jgi:hypothetical protein
LWVKSGWRRTRSDFSFGPVLRSLRSADRESSYTLLGYGACLSARLPRLHSGSCRADEYEYPDSVWTLLPVWYRHMIGRWGAEPGGMDVAAPPITLPPAAAKWALTNRSQGRDAVTAGILRERPSQAITVLRNPRWITLGAGDDRKGESRDRSPRPDVAGRSLPAPLQPQLIDQNCRCLPLCSRYLFRRTTSSIPGNFLS